MASYKLIQNIEAEDKILGPFTLRQFIFALIAIFCFYMCFLGLTRHLAFILVIFLPLAIFFGFFALPFGRDQPTEIWFLAKLRFWFKPKNRVWDQSGVKELVTITAPKKVERVLTDGLNEYEVKSRLQALANTLDSRGWAVKNMALDINAPINTAASPPSDRLVDPANFPKEVPDNEIRPSDDILDAQSNPIAQQFDQMITASSQAYRQRLINQLNAPVQPQPISATSAQWFMPHAAAATAAPIPVTATEVPPQPESPEDLELAAQLQAKNRALNQSYGHLHTVQPLSAQPPRTVPVSNTSTPAPPVTAQPDPAILSLASNDDFSVATIARQAQRVKNNDKNQDEVVISLH